MIDVDPVGKDCDLTKVLAGTLESFGIMFLRIRNETIQLLASF